MSALINSTNSSHSRSRATSSPIRTIATAHSHRPTQARITYKGSGNMVLRIFPKRWMAWRQYGLTIFGELVNLLRGRRCRHRPSYTSSFCGLSSRSHWRSLLLSSSQRPWRKPSTAVFHFFMAPGFLIGRFLITNWKPAPAWRNLQNQQELDSLRTMASGGCRSKMGHIHENVDDLPLEC
jgi:hypothetical protein